MSIPVGNPLDHVPILRMFEKTAPPLITVPAVHALFDKFAEHVAGGLNELAPLELTTRLEQLDQGPTADFLQAAPDIHTVAGSIMEWGAIAYVRIDSMLLFRLLDAMYGGDPGQRTAPPQRPLTTFESELAIQLGKVVIVRLAEILSELCTFTFSSVRLVDAAAEAAVVEVGDSVIIAVSVVETGERITVVVPARGLELVREKTVAKEEGKAEPGFDPEWAAGFKKSVLASTVPLAAIVEGPAMTLSDVARLRIGSVIELDSDALKRVRIESDDKPLYFGQLGQGRGVFTVLLDDVVTNSRAPQP